MGDKKFPYFIQVCVFPFTYESLKDYSSLESTPLEEIESIDFLRFLENGRKIKAIETNYETYSVDIPSDIHKVINIMQDDPLFKEKLY